MSSLHADSIATEPIAPLRFTEFIRACLIILIVLTAEIAVCKPRVLFGGPFWLDECITDQIIQDPSLSHALGAIRHGVDTNPPIFHIIDRILWRAEQSLGLRSPQWGLRIISFACAAGALMLLYALLRRAFPPIAAAAGVAAVWAHPDLVEQATDARFYAPMFFAAVAVCAIASWTRRPWWGHLLLATASALLCTLHYFGVLALACVAVAMLLADRRPFDRRVASLLPMLAGPLALAPFLPWIRDQSAGLSVKTWLDPFSFFLAKAFLGDVLCPLALLVIVGVWVTARLLAREAEPTVDQPVDEPGEQPDRRVTLTLLAMIAVPLVIVVFSATVQSALRSRYAIVAALALAPLAAMIACRVDRKMVIVMLVLLSALSVMELHGNAGRRAALLATLTRQRDDWTGESQVKSRDGTPPLPIVFAARSDAVEMQRFAPQLSGRYFILDEAGPGITVRPFRTYETDMARKVAAWYAEPALIDQTILSRIPRFHLLAPDEDLPAIIRLPKLRYSGKGDVFETIDGSPIN